MGEITSLGLCHQPRLRALRRSSSTTYHLRRNGATVLPDLRRSAPSVLNGLDKILGGAMVNRRMPRFAEFDKTMIAQLRAYLLDERRKLAAAP
jgi:hypothetical protein